MHDCNSRLLSMLFLWKISPARNDFPLREVLAQDFELGHSAFVSIVAKKKMVRRFWGLDRFDDRVCRTNRITGLFAGDSAHLFSPCARRRRVIVNLPLAFIRRTPG